MKSVLRVENLSVNLKTYAGVVRAVRDISFELNGKETLVIVGESGCGKTMAAKAIMGLLPEDIAGFEKNSKIFFEGNDLTKLNEKQMQKIRGCKISMIFQDPMTYLNPTMNIGDQIAEVFIIHDKISKKEALIKSLEVLRAVKIAEPESRLEQYPHELSGGMRQRIVIAMALACKPSVLIADEPTTALDVTIQADIMDLIHDLQLELDMAMILVTHDLGIAAEVSDRIQVMYAGEIVETGSKSDILKNPKHPYTWALLKSVPDISKGAKAELYYLKGSAMDLLECNEGCSFAPRCEYCMEICKKRKPLFENVDGDHSVSCWLTHNLAPDIECESIIEYSSGVNTSNSFDMKNVNYSSVDVNKRRII